MRIMGMARANIGFSLKVTEFGSLLRSLTLENPQIAKYMDGIIADLAHGTMFIQVKWSQQDDISAFTLHNLVTTEDESVSLIVKLDRGFRQVCNEDGQKQMRRPTASPPCPFADGTDDSMNTTATPNGCPSGTQKSAQYSNADL
jgi:hypothetical protein